MTLSIQTSMTLADIVTQHPPVAADLERLGLDYCCHGGRTLDVAATDAGLDPQAIADQLSARSGDASPALWASLAPTDLIDDIETVHHRYLWAELPRLTALVDKIVDVHGDRHPELVDVQRLYGELRTDLEPHLRREEQELFPGIRQFWGTGGPPSDLEQFAALIEITTTEHDTVGVLLEDLRRVTDGYTVPADGCASYTACYRALAELEADTHLHVHKENNVLLPAVQTRRAESDNRPAPSTDLFAQKPAP